MHERLTKYPEHTLMFCLTASARAVITVHSVERATKQIALLVLLSRPGCGFKGIVRHAPSTNLRSVFFLPLSIN